LTFDLLTLTMVSNRVTNVWRGLHLWQF